MQTVRQVVVGIDFSEQAEQALELAVRLAAAVGARVTLVHVCEPSVDERLDEERRRRSADELAQLVARHGGAVPVSGILRSGRPWEKLDNVAAEVGASLIVVGRHGAGLGRGVALGSGECGAERLVHLLRQRVLFVRSRKRDSENAFFSSDAHVLGHDRSSID